MNNKYLVIDLFAGPGGLGEGFSAFRIKKSKHPFKIALSIEKDIFAHSTLKLRSFFRQFDTNKVPMEYYQYLEGEISKEELFQKYPIQAKKASEEAWYAELGKKPYSEVRQKIKKALNKTKKWVLIGGPPCQAYSIVGRVRMMGKKPDDFENDKRHFLYREYLRIIRDHKPPIFVMENVTGILSSKINGKYIFDQILNDLHCPINAFRGSKKQLTVNDNLKYQIYSLVEDRKESDSHEKNGYVIKCEDYGIPQRRHRVILLGVRSDLKIRPSLLMKASAEIKMWDVLKDLPKLRSGTNDTFDSPDNWKKTIAEIKDSGWVKKRIADTVFINYMKKNLTKIKSSTDLSLGDSYISNKKVLKCCKEWFIDPRLGGICNHTARKHIKKDLHRYFYASCFAVKYGKSPQIKDFPKAIWPKHKNISEAFLGDMFSDRFRVQLKNKPSTTITSHISKDGHYYIHPDPVQCRSLTVREAARLQTFPDNYYFEGPRTSQYIQVGNAVPPLLAKQIGQLVYDVIRQLD